MTIEELSSAFENLTDKEALAALEKIIAYIQRVAWQKPIYLVLLKCRDALKKQIQEPLRHGEWLENGANYKCSVCGNTESCYGDNYCRVCGAKMDEEEQNDDGS